MCPSVQCEFLRAERRIECLGRRPSRAYVDAVLKSRAMPDTADNAELSVAPMAVTGSASDVSFVHIARHMRSIYIIRYHASNVVASG